DVQRPGAAGRLLEQGAELVPVHGAALEEGQDPVLHRHSYRVCILSMARATLAGKAQLSGVTAGPWPASGPVPRSSGEHAGDRVGEAGGDVRDAVPDRLADVRDRDRPRGDEEDNEGDSDVFAVLLHDDATTCPVRTVRWPPGGPIPHCP